MEVIDGQQRLATTSIALSAMRHHVHSIIPNLARALDDFLTNVDPNTLEPSPKMRLNTADTNVFHSIISDGNAGPGFMKHRPSHENLRRAQGVAASRWADIAKPYDATNQVDIFKKWMNYIEFNAKVILLQVPNNVNAFKMFETLNDRGLKTSQADLVKNYILGESGENLQTAQEKWGYIKGSLEAVGEDDITVNFLRQALICQYGYLKESQVYEQVQKTVRGKSTSEQFLTNIEIQARDYASLFNPGSDKWTSYPLSARKSLEVLSLFDIKPFRPLMLAISGKFPVKGAAKALQGLVSLGVRLIIASSTRSGSVEQPLARAAHQVFTDKINDVEELFSFLKNVIPSDEQFRSAFSVATVSNPKFARYYLRSIERADKDDKEPWFLPNEDSLSITLEHVLPIKPQGNWPSFSDDEAKLYAKRIGNLALLQAKTNSDLKSDSFGEKRAAFEQSPYGTTSMISEAETWNPDEINERQKRLAELAVLAWPLPFPA